MDVSAFQKMKAKSGKTARVFNAPKGYPRFVELDWMDTDDADIVHLFVESSDQFKAFFAEAIDAANEKALVWVSYPKSIGKRRYDINRDSLWDLLLAHGWHPVAQISLDDQWSAVRVKPNETGREYVRPNNVKT